MLERYGTYAAEVLAALPVVQQPLAHAPGYSVEEIAFLAEREEVVSLLDLILRRTHIAFVGHVTTETLVDVAEAAAPVLGWDRDAVQSQVDATAEALRDAHRIDVRTSGLAPLGA